MVRESRCWWSKLDPRSGKFLVVVYKAKGQGRIWYPWQSQRSRTCLVIKVKGHFFIYIFIFFSELGFISFPNIISIVSLRCMYQCPIQFWSLQYAHADEYLMRDKILYDTGIPKECYFVKFYILIFFFNWSFYVLFFLILLISNNLSFCRTNFCRWFVVVDIPDNFNCCCWNLDVIYLFLLQGSDDVPGDCLHILMNYEIS